MPENAAVLFDRMNVMMKHLKRSKYEEHMKNFRKENEDFFKEMTAFVSGSQDPQAAASEFADGFTASVKEAFSKKGKIRGTLQVDLNFFMIYYVFPAILLTEDSNAKLIADTLCKTWGKDFPDSKIRYTDYESLRGKFREKFLGIF